VLTVRTEVTDRMLQVNRVDLRDSEAPDQNHQGARLAATVLAMAFKLMESAQDRWRAVNAPHLAALVRAGARFEGGQFVERPDEHPAPAAA
jgi:hypothetical protein